MDNPTGNPSTPINIIDMSNNNNNNNIYVDRDPEPPPVRRQPATIHLNEQNSIFSDVQRQLNFYNN